MAYNVVCKKGGWRMSQIRFKCKVPTKVRHKKEVSYIKWQSLPEDQRAREEWRKQVNTGRELIWRDMVAFYHVAPPVDNPAIKKLRAKLKKAKAMAYATETIYTDSDGVEWLEIKTF